MIVQRSIDVENEVRLVLDEYFTIYCRPLPKDFSTPSLLVSLTGGNGTNNIDSFQITLDSRATNSEEALNLLLDATATLKELARLQESKLRYVVINTIGSWGIDPLRPELALSSAQLTVFTHIEQKTITKKI